MQIRATKRSLLIVAESRPSKLREKRTNNVKRGIDRTRDIKLSEDPRQYGTRELIKKRSTLRKRSSSTICHLFVARATQNLPTKGDTNNACCTKRTDRSRTLRNFELIYKRNPRRERGWTDFLRGLERSPISRIPRT